jgi:hypothetical protein
MTPGVATEPEARPMRSGNRDHHRLPERNRIMKRLAVVFLATLAALVAAAPSAQAAPPTHDLVPIDETFTDNEACDFPVQGHATGFMLTIEWVDEDGTTRRFEGFPQAKLTLTMTTGRSITANTAGAFHLTENPDGSLTAAGTGNWGFPFDLETGEPGFLLYSGRWVFSIDAQGNESFRFDGRVRDLCTELAA